MVSEKGTEDMEEELVEEMVDLYFDIASEPGHPFEHGSFMFLL
jgi:hypothetical protein